MELRQSVSLLQSYFDFYYANEIRLKMHRVFQTKCSGCQSSRLSQIDHACLMLTEEQQLKLHFEDILLDVDESEILKQWNDAVTVIGIPSELIEMFGLKLGCLDWRQADMKSAKCRDRMIHMTMRLLHLERRFYQHNKTTDDF